MNPFNILINYIIADSRAKHYNVSEPQKVKNIALIMGSFSQNTMMDYLIIDNQAKNLQQNSVVAIANLVPSTNVENTQVDSKKEIVITEKIKEEISDIVSTKILSKLSDHLLKSENPETIKLLSDFRNDLSYFNTLLEKNEIEKTKKDIEELLKNKNIKSLDKNYQPTITKLRKIVAENGYLNQMESLIENQKEYSSIKFELLFSNSSISRVIYDIEEKLRKIELDKSVATSKE
jgi:major membrane immunogen (membrane-anchored lipoprotein)